MTAVPDRVAVLAEDDAALRGILCRVLGMRGFRVVAEDDGRRALDACLAEKPALIVTDLHMPGLSGTELVKAARAAGLDAPALLMSSSPSIDAQDLPRREKKVALLSKPFPLDAFVKAVERLLAS